MWTLARTLAACIALAVAPGALGPHPTLGALVRSQAAEEPWKVEFDGVCSRTQDAMSLSADELRGLIRRCDDLKPKVDALDESRAKVFGRRLQACRDLYQYVLQARENG